LVEQPHKVAHSVAAAAAVQSTREALFIAPIWNRFQKDSSDGGTKSKGSHLTKSESVALVPAIAKLSGLPAANQHWSHRGSRLMD
jgi:hypothetical protein